MKCFASVLVVLIFSFAGLAQRTEPASKTELADITERGRALAEYDVAAWHSTDAVVALKPPAGSFERYVAQKSGTGWTVAFGKFNANRDKFLIVYEAVQDKSPKDFKVRKYEPPKEDSGFLLFAARAADLASKDFGVVDRPYNVAVIPTKGNKLYVYLLPAQTKVGVFPLGADVRYLVSADGQKIVEKRQLHKSILDFSPPADLKVDADYHISVLDDVPEDTDVFHVLARQPSVMMWIITDKYVYRISQDGSIIYVMTKEAFLKIGKPSP